ncbi:transketolase [Pseudomonas sp. REP124]|uniref:transketolase n=1 Tax=unclassified Pseudomonas TaxID=196821 RepID=UPI00158635AF|nr:MULTISPECIES: transketolase [unclassified Pseudomonas]MBZ9780269.1 transketolase [Pseudomonas sp. REP124]NUT78725.1 transketolase [Pseudomonas sp. C1C7]
MQGTPPSATWLKPPSADAAVVIVSSATLPPYMNHQLHRAIDDWDQVAHLVVQQSGAFMQDWLQAGSNPDEPTLAATCQASQLLSCVAKGCFLLDVEVGPVPSLTWLGSVRGHPLRLVRLGKEASSHAAMDQQVEEILALTRTLAKSVLQERCGL